jgi:ABC-2 type transport system ATP-binding protein
MISAGRRSPGPRRGLHRPATGSARRSGGERGGATVLTEGLTKRFGAFTAVDHVDLRVEAGQLYGFLGPNGAGKSTTLRMLCGILEPSDGNGRVLGIDLRQEPERIKAAIGYMSQRFSLYDDLSAAENLVFYSMVYGVRGRLRRERIDRMVTRGPGRPRGHAGRPLSGGYRQRLALACALVHSPKLMFLDDDRRRRPGLPAHVRELIRRLADNGVTVLVTTHYMDEAEHCTASGSSTRRLIAQGTPARSRPTRSAGPCSRWDAGAPAGDRRAVRLAGRGGGHPLRPAGAGRRRGRGSPSRRSWAPAGRRARGVCPMVSPTIEDVFIVRRQGPEARLRQQLDAF